MLFDGDYPAFEAEEDSETVVEIEVKKNGDYVVIVNGNPVEAFDKLHEAVALMKQLQGMESEELKAILQL